MTSEVDRVPGKSSSTTLKLALVSLDIFLRSLTGKAETEKSAILKSQKFNDHLCGNLNRSIVWPTDGRTILAIPYEITIRHALPAITLMTLGMKPISA